MSNRSKHSSTLPSSAVSPPQTEHQKRLAAWESLSDINLRKAAALETAHRSIVSTLDEFAGFVPYECVDVVVDPGNNRIKVVIDFGRPPFAIVRSRFYKYYRPTTLNPIHFARDIGMIWTLYSLNKMNVHNDGATSWTNDGAIKTQLLSSGWTHYG